MLGKVAERFRRTNWKSVQELADELWAVFHRPMAIQPSSITITQPANSDETPITLNRPDGIASPAITVTGGNTTLNLGGGSSGGGGGGINLGDVTFPGQDQTTVNLSVPPANNNPFALHGIVQGKVGGTVYQVACYAKDPAAFPAIGVLNVDFPAVDPDDTIPAGTPTPVVAFPVTAGGATTIGKAVGYVPVFLTPE